MEIEPITKPKKKLSEAQLANLKKGREIGLAKARAKKAEKEKQKKEDEEILLKAKTEIKKIDIEPLSEEPPIIEPVEPIIKEENDGDYADDELDKPQPLLRRRSKKNVEPIETKKNEVKQTAKERLAEMRAKKKMELEEKKLKLEELKIQTEIEEQESKINEIKSKPKNSLSSTVPYNTTQPEVIFAPRRGRGRGRYF